MLSTHFPAVDWFADDVDDALVATALDLLAEEDDEPDD